MVNTFGGTWESFYTSKLCKWLHDDNIPLPITLETIFTFLQYVEEDAEVQTVFNDVRQVRHTPCLTLGTIILFLFVFMHVDDAVMCVDGDIS